MKEFKINQDRNFFLSFYYNEYNEERREEDEFINEVIRGITGFWIGGVDFINWIWFDIFCNRQGRKRNRG